MQNMDNLLLNTCKKLILERYPNMLAIYVFGSVGTPYFTKDSDIDIAIQPLTHHKIDSYELWKFAQEIAIAINRDVDLIDLNAASTVFRYEIITTGRRIYCSDENHCNDIEVLYISMYLNFAEERKDLLEAFKKPA